MIKGSDVSVVIATIPGREELLKRALASVMKQQVQPGRVIVQLDEQRLGAAWCRNEAIKQVTTPWISVIDDDDAMLPTHLKILIRGANKSKADLIFTYPKFVGGRDPLACLDNTGKHLIPEPINVPFGPMQEYSLRTRGGFIPCAVLVRTDMVRKIGGYPEPYSMPEIQNGSGDCEDYLLQIKLLDAGAKFHHVLGVATYSYFIHDGNLGGRGLDRMAELSDPSTIHQRQGNA